MAALTPIDIFSVGNIVGEGGSLYSIDARGEVRCQLQGISISNGLCLSPDGAQLYFADSPTRTIRAFEVLEPEGILGASQVFARTPEGAFPDRAAVDADGCIWSAHWGAGEIPTCQPSCVCFGGPDLDVLCVTSAREGLDGSTLRAEPHAGDVFLYRAGVQGLPESEYRQ